MFLLQSQYYQFIYYLFFYLSFLIVVVYILIHQHHHPNSILHIQISLFYLFILFFNQQPYLLCFTQLCFAQPTHSPTSMYQQHLYKQQLYNTLSNDHSLVDNVKLHLRQKIIHKLKSSTGANIVGVKPQKEFIQKIIHSLIHQYLSIERMFHTLAVFTPQIGHNNKALLKTQELKQLLKISNQNDQNISTLEHLLQSLLPKGRLTSITTSTSCQTDDKQTIQNLQNKLSHIEFQYKQKAIQGLKSVQDSQQRFLKYKNEINKRYKDELQSQIRRIRDFEIAKVRMEQQQKYRIKLRDYQQQLQMGYQSKLQKLRQRQSQVMNRVATKMKQVQSYNYQMRQNVLRDMEMVRVKEEEVERLRSAVMEERRRGGGEEGR